MHSKIQRHLALEWGTETSMMSLRWRENARDSKLARLCVLGYRGELLPTNEVDPAEQSPGPSGEDVKFEVEGKD